MSQKSVLRSKIGDFSWKRLVFLSDSSECIKRLLFEVKAKWYHPLRLKIAKREYALKVEQLIQRNQSKLKRISKKFGQIKFEFQFRAIPVKVSPL